MGIIEFLEKDHDRIRSLFSELEGTDAPQDLDDCFDKLDNILTIHARVEELVLYPEVRNWEDTFELIDRGQQEHTKGEQMVLVIKSTTSNSSEFKENISELQKFMLNHLHEEENDLFPKVRQGMDDEKLEQLGNQLREAKVTLADKIAVTD
jgi:hemerythrin superfamily protein